MTLKNFPNLNKDRDFSFISETKLDDYILKIHEASTNHNQMQSLQVKFKESDPELVELLSMMLEFNP